MESCNVTAMIMALSYLGYTFPKGNYEQPEDNLREFIETAEKNPENHYELSEYTNRWIGKTVTSFSTNRLITTIFKELIDGRPVVVSGTFPGFPTRRQKPLGHIVCLVGAEWEDAEYHGTETTAQPVRVIWDDPYGNTMEDWRSSGNDIVVNYQFFREWLKPVNNEKVKWGHFFFHV
ncbi:MAG: C39 family peptidase [Spirochaetaceae bacterium]|nr:C39 family peptidase [Spirochaetaceae bacterium]